MTKPNEPVPESADSRWEIFGETYICRVPSEATNGRYSVMEEVVPAGFHSPYHLHEQTDEVFLVVEGEVEFLLDGRTRVARSGEAIAVPRGTPHSVANRTSGECRYLVVMTPGRFIDFFRQVASMSEHSRTDEAVGELYAAHRSRIVSAQLESQFESAESFVFRKAPSGLANDTGVHLFVDSSLADLRSDESSTTTLRRIPIRPPIST